MLKKNGLLLNHLRAEFDELKKTVARQQEEVEEFDKLKATVVRLQAEVEELQFRPGGPEFLRAKERFTRQQQYQAEAAEADGNNGEVQGLDEDSD